MKKVVLCILLLCSYMAAISQNPILRKDVSPGSTESGIQQIVKTSNYSFFNAEDGDADTDRDLYRTDGSAGGSSKLDFSYSTIHYVKKDISSGLALDNWGVVGSATPNGWGAGPDIPLSYNAGLNTWSAVVTLSNGEIKFRNNNDWAVNYGDNGADGSLDPGGSNIAVTVGTYLITLDFTTLTYSIFSPSVSIPDPNFEQALIDLGFDKDGVVNASILRSDAEAVIDLNVNNKNITSLQGIEAFKNLSRLFCQNNQIQAMDISKNTALTILECGGNQLTGLNVTKNLLLKTLGFGYNNITNIDVSQNLKLEVFWSNNNQIRSQYLDLNSALTVVGISNNPLTFVSLKNGNNIKIAYFEAYNTPGLVCINSDAVVSVSMNNSGKTFSENCSKAYYVNDNLQTGDLFTTAIGNNTNAGTKAAPFATITYALSQSAERDTIYVDAGNYTEQVTTDKGIIIIGAGQNLTSILKPAITVAPPGSFLEQGVIQTAQSITGDVHISNLSVTGGLNPGVTPIIIQSGGSVKNCNLQNGNQGIFVRIDPTINLNAKTFVVDGNTINAEYIAVHFAGGIRLTAILTNNNIAAFNPGSSGAWAGTDFGTLNGLTITGNKFSSYGSDGLFVNTNNGTISQNSFTGTGLKAINRSGGSTINATCNWYGSADAAVVVPKISTNVTYSPWLTNGTDIDVATGFQPVANACTGRQNKFYVNDANITGNVFTTAVGNDANTGLPSAPLLTLTAAYNKAQAGDTIYVDAGLYDLGGLTYSFPKAITFLGANYLVSPNDAVDKLQPNTSRNAESIINNFTFLITSNDLSFEGFTIDPGNRTLLSLSNAAFGRLKFRRNHVRISSSVSVFNLSGAATTDPALLTSSDYLFDDNRFNRSASGSGITFSLNYLKNVLLSNNSGVITGPTTRAQTFAAVGQSGVVDSLSLTGNVIDRANNTLFTLLVARLYVTGNKIYNASRYLFIQTNVPGSTDVLVENNEIVHNLPGAAISGIITCSRFSGNSAATNMARIRNNNIMIDATGLSFVPSAISGFNAGTLLNPVLEISGNKITNAGNYSSLTSIFNGISVTGNLLNASITANELVNSGTNYLLSPINSSAATSSGIQMATDAGINSVTASAVININNNKVSGYKQSLVFYDFSTVAPNTYTGYGNLPAGVSVNIRNNSLTGDSISINNGSIGQIVDASCNWYGSNTEEDIYNKVSLATVKLIPWLTDGTDNDAATGFQPVANSCNGYPRKLYVNDNIQTGDVFTTAIGDNANPGTAAAPFASIDYAISKAKNGDSIYIDAGTYAQTAALLLNKSITILGSNYLVSPNDVTTKTIYNSSRNTEARITGAAFVIGADNIFIKGLRFSPTASAISQNGNYSHVKIEKTYFDVVGTGNIVNLQGASGNPIVAFDFSITDSRFERTDISTGASINLGLVRSVWIDDNVFIESPVGNPNRGIAVRTVSGQLVESTAFTNNYMKKLQNAVSALTINDWVIAGNKFDSCSLGFNYSPVAVVAGFVRVAGNTFTNMRSTRSVLVRGGSAGGANNLIISDNIINQEVNGTNGTTSIIQLEFTTSNTFGSAIVANNIINISGDYSQAITKMNNGIQLSGKHTNTTIEGNEVNFSAINAALPSVPNVFPPVPSAVFINTDAGSGLGLIPSTAIINIRNNKFSGFKTGVAFYDPSASGITGNIGYGHLTTGATVNINNNSFTNDSMSIDNGTVSQNVNASCNWYGSAAAQNVIYKLSLSTVDIVPWLTNGTDNDVATGFQPVPGSCDGYPTLITLNGSTNVICNGAANGTINITTSYGKAPFTYTWTKEGDANFILHDEDPTGLAPGTYHLAILDGNGSNVYITDPEANGPGTITVIITQPTQLTATITNSSTACSNIATVTADGGTAGYTYLWSNGSTSATIAGVPVGTYTVTVTDANGCTVTASITLTVAEAFNPSASVTNVTCFAENNGIITVTNANGNGQLMFSKDGGVSFENGLLPFSFTNLAPGTYNIAVKDVSGCTGFVEKTVTQPTQLTATISNVRSTCFNQSTGAINVSVSGGVPAYSYSWTGLAGTFSSSQLNISSLAAGDYTLTVRDNNNCSYSLPVTVPTNDEVVVNETVNHVTCRGSLNGSISVSASGGSGSQLGFSYLWNTGSTSTTISNLAPGNYNVRITDNENGCFINKAYTVTQPASVLALTTTKTNATGCNSLGTITGIASGGTAPYSYSINGSIITGNSKVGLYAGDYTVTVTDANGCTTSKLVTITDNGSDEYEGNNSKNQAKTIPVGTPVNARLALATDAADWFKFTAPGSTSGLYSIKIVHPNVVYTFNVYASGNNTPALAPVSIINNGEKHYQLTAGTTYFVSITTASLSFICYNLTVSALEPIEVTANTPQSSMTVETTPAVDVLKAFTYPNPHNGNFTLSIESPEEGVATIEMFTVNGQKLSERKANVVKGKGNTVKYSNMNYAILFYKVSIGKRVATGKIISPN